MKGFILVIGLLFMASCNNQQAETEPAEDSTETEIVYDEPQAPNFEIHFPELSNFLSSSDSSFNTNRFTVGEVISQDTTAPVNVEKGSLQTYYPYFVFNSDSTKALDLVSYNFIETTRKGKTKFDFAGPDTEIGIVDIKSQTRKRILFLGSSGIVLDGKWADNNTVILVGAEDAGDGNLHPLMWRYHLDTYELEVFSYPGTIKASANEYYERKYNNKNDKRVRSV